MALKEMKSNFGFYDLIGLWSIWEILLSVKIMRFSQVYNNAEIGTDLSIYRALVNSQASYPSGNSSIAFRI